MWMKGSWPRLVVALALIASVMAGTLAAPALAGPPTPAKGQGDKCVAPTDWMRRNHMKGLMHHRQRTVHEGIRTPQFDLNRCIDCHQVKGDDGKPVTVSDSRHFCRTCHDYAAVKLDCFECHASRPGETTTTGGLEGSPHGAPGAGDVASLNRYLEGAGR
ncbi:MAG: hypothetical protein KDJ47_15695 [Hyphomicrobiaceae bacterium]|nr:hypothetical protein [Hyphomicrobiaceae bacterium]